MKKLIILLLIICALRAGAQQDPVFSQYWVNATVINPAQTAVNGGTSVSLTGRYQWVSIKGAPQTHALTFSTLQAENVGLGASYVLDRVGPVTSNTLNIDVGYHLKLSRDWVASFGARLSANITQVNLTDLYTAQAGDPAFSQNLGGFTPNLGFGLLLHNRNMYFGYGEPRSIDYDLSESNNVNVRIRTHRFLYGGYNVAINDKVELRPSLLFKYVSYAPVQMDVNVSAEFIERISGGLSYRSGDGIGIMMGYAPVEKLRVYYCYDYPLSAIAMVSRQTHQISLVYNFRRSEEMNSLKYFE